MGRLASTASDVQDVPSKSSTALLNSEAWVTPGPQMLCLNICYFDMNVCSGTIFSWIVLRIAKETL